MIRVFKRKVWKRNSQWPDGFEPEHGRKTPVALVETPEQAREICLDANSTVPKRGTVAYYTFSWHEFEEA